MSATQLSTSSPTLPAGRYRLDPVHSSASFAVKHMAVATFRGRFEDFDASLTVDSDGAATLTGVVQVGSIEVKDPNLKAHLGSPDFFDLERHPEIRFEASQIEIGQDGGLKVTGELTIKGQTHPVHAHGTISGPAVTLGDVVKIGIALETVIDRTQFGLAWNAPLPKGGVALANDVKLTVELELAREEAQGGELAREGA
jgi:polyisoprenoid-binding protein YceI